MAGSSFNLSGNVDLNAGGAINAANQLAQRFKALTNNSRTTAQTLRQTAQGMEAAARAAATERKSLIGLAQAQEKINKSRRESIALAAKTRAQASAITSKAADASGLAFNRKQIALGESMAKITRENTNAEARLNTERLRGVQIVERTKNENNNANGRQALLQARAQTEAVRQRVALENQASTVASRALRDQIALQREARAAKSNTELGTTGTRYALLQGAATAGVAARAILGVSAAYGKLIVEGEKSTISIVRTNDAFKNAANGVELARKQFGALSQEIPETYEDLAKIGTLAGQLGIQSKGLGDFTRYVSEFSAITGVSVEDTATAFARLNSVVPGVNNNYKGLADSIAKVGVNSVATEGDIIRVTTQISSVAAQAGFSADQIIGLSGALSSIGVPPELSRGVVTRTFGLISRAASGGGIQLEKFAAATGVSAAEFKKGWSEDASGTFVKFMTNLRKQGAGAENTLRGLGITSVRDVPVLLRLANAADSSGKRLGDAGKNAGLLAQTLNDAKNPANEVSKQFALINRSVGAKLQLLLNSIGVALREIGATNLGPLGSTISALTRGVTQFSQSLDKPVKLLGMIDLPFTNGEMLGWVAIGTAIAGALALIVAGLSGVAASLLLVDQLGQRALGKSLLGGLSNLTRGFGMAGAASTRMATTSGAGLALVGRNAATAEKSVARVTQQFGKAGAAPTIFTRIGGAVNGASDKVTSLGGKVKSLGSSLGGLAKTFAPELITAGFVGILTYADQATQAVTRAGSSVEDMAAYLKTARTQGELLSKIRLATPVGFMGLGGQTISNPLKNVKALDSALTQLGDNSAINNFKTLTFNTGLQQGANKGSQLGYAKTTDALKKVQEGFNQIVDSGDMDSAISGIQTFFKGLSGPAIDNSLGRMDDVTAALTTRLESLGLEANKTNLRKIATGAIGTTKQLQNLSQAVSDTTPAFEGSGDAASGFIDSVNSAYTGMVDFNTSYQGVLDKVNDAAKRKWVAAGNNISDFKEVAVSNLDDFYKTLDKQFATAGAFQSNVATIMGTIGAEYGAQLETLPPKLVEAVAKGGPAAMEKLRGYLDQLNAGPIIAANMAKAASDPGLQKAFIAAGGKSAAEFNKALASGVDIEDTIAQMKRQMDLNIKTAQVKIKIGGDTVPLRKDGEDAKAYLERLEAFMKVHGDTKIARADFKSAADYANGLDAYIKARGDIAPARADFASAKEYGDALEAFLTLKGYNVPAIQAADGTKGYIQGLEAVIEIKGNGELARRDGESDADYISRLQATMKILGDKAPAQAEGQSAQDYINSLQARLVIDADNSLAKGKARDAKSAADNTTGTVKINGNNRPATSTLSQTKGKIDGTYGTMQIKGNNRPANAATSAATSYANRSTATIRVDANVSNALSAIGSVVNRAWTAVVKTVTGKATGGPVHGPGTGTSDSIPVNLSDGEYVIRASQAAKHMDLLNAINYGRKGYATGGMVTPGSAVYNDTSTAVQTAAVGARDRSVERGNSVYNVTELSAYDRHLLQVIADNIGVTIAPSHIAQATTGTYRKQSQRGNG